MGYIGSGPTKFNTADGLTVTGDAEIGDDLLLNSDSAVLSVGADADLKITHDGTNGDFESAGNLTFDIAGDINLDADGGEVNFQDGGTTIAYLGNSSTDLLLGVSTSDKDLYIQGNDGGSTINALKLDMSAGGLATFNAGASFAGTVGIGTTSVTTGQMEVAGGIYLSGSSNFVRFGENSSTPAGVAIHRPAANTLGFVTASTEHMRIDSSGNVGIGGTPSYPLHVQSGSTSSVVRITNTGNADANVNSILQLATTTNVAQLLLNEVNNYSQYSHSGDLSSHYVDVDNQYFRNKAGTQRLVLTSTGKVETTSRDFGFHNHGTTVTLADDAYITINGATAGGGLLAIYDTASGANAVYRVGYLNCEILSNSVANFAAADTDGKICVLSSQHTIYIKNRLGASKAFYINMFMAGNNFAG